MNWYKIAQHENWYNTEVAKDPNTSPEILAKVLEKGKDNFVSYHAAKNPNCPAKSLAKVLERGRNDLVSQYAAENLNCPAEALAKILEKGKDNLVSQYAAANLNCPPEALAKVLERGKDDYVSRCAARNSNCPAEALAKVLERGKNDFVSRIAALNPNCPAEALVKVLARGNDDYASRNVAQNPNCPFRAKIDWLRTTGQIKSEDENSILEEQEQPDNSDLEKFKDLLAKFDLRKQHKTAQHEPWEKTKKELLDSLLFHGTSESIEGDLRGGAYDNIFWTADSPTIAQTYIPLSGIITYFHKPKYRLDEMIKPDNGINDAILKALGYDLFDTVERDEHGRVRSYQIPDEGKDKFTKQKAIEYIENVLGYEPEDGVYKLFTDIEKGGEHIIYPASYKEPGQLFMMIGRENLNLYDMANGREEDLMNPDYHKLEVFKKLADKGYDGVIIRDFAQSSTWGNVGHISYGIFPQGLKKLQHIDIPATNFDWSDKGLLSEKFTPEFERWHKEEVKKALNAGKPVPQAVLEEYNELV